MLYSGADLIKTSSLQHERAARLEIASKEVKPPAPPGDSKLDEDTKGALLRFARFINKDGKRPPPPPQKKTVGGAGQKHPYIVLKEAQTHLFEVGQNIDIYV